VSDIIQMSQFADPRYIAGQSVTFDVAQFSPDGLEFVIVLKRGNLETDTNDYSLLLFTTINALRSPAPRVLETFSSSSNRPGIQKVSWISDHVIAFLGENPGEQQQLYTLDINSRRVHKLTNHSTSLCSYAIDGNDHRIFFTAEVPAESFLTDESRRNGVRVTTQFLSDLVAGTNRFDGYYRRELFTKGIRSGNEKRIDTGNPIAAPGDLFLSPDERYLIFKASIVNPPDEWGDYDDTSLRMWIREKHPPGVPSWVFSYVIMNTGTGESEPLLDAPLGSFGSADVAWSPDSHSILIAGTYLPLLRGDANEQARRVASYVAEVRIPGREIVPIAQRDLKLVQWNAAINRALFEASPRLSSVDIRGPLVAYEKTGQGWREVTATTADVNPGRPLRIQLEEDMNTPPKLVILDSSGQQRTVLLDLNPQLEHLSLASVQDIVFSASNGNKIQSGFYLPPDYIAGRKYPLVIQTHGWNPQRFWMDGPYSTAFAAQALAARDIIVLQLEENVNDMSTPEEPLREASAYEGAIDFLDERGMIDRNRVGIIAFSRPGLAVKYALTHSQFRFAAATIADGSDDGYFQYIALANAYPALAADSEGIIGARPFAAGLTQWMDSSPDFELEKVTTPIRIEVLEPETLFVNWEWFAGLSRLGKPVELIYLPDAAHMLVKPWDRLISQQGNVDWFCYWLKGEEDPDPDKAEQYARWRELRKLQEQNQRTAPKN
jgi:hypothetical protein